MIYTQHDSLSCNPSLQKMEGAILSSCLTLSAPRPPSSPRFTCCSPSLTTSLSLPLTCASPRRSQQSHLVSWRNRSWISVRSSASEIPSLVASEKWLFEPIGDGDSRHIGYRVPLPNAFEIVSDVVTVGRLPEKADMVIPVATVSGAHARLEKKGGALLVTDLDSTNGTFINDTRLRPGAVTSISPGSCVVFGDTHLAMFRVSKLEEQKGSTSNTDDESEIKKEAESGTSSS